MHLCFAAVGIIDVRNNDPEAIQVPSDSRRIAFCLVGVGGKGIPGVLKEGRVLRVKAVCMVGQAAG